MRTIRLGMLTPSSNTVLEPITYGLVREMSDISVHFARFEVVQISLGAASTAQFEDAPILEAARHLSHAKCHSITWNGTSASWLGFERDEHLISRVSAATGASAATCVLGFREIFHRLALRRIGLVTPYTRDVQRRIQENFRKAGFACSAERHSGIADNYSFAGVPESEIEAMTRAVIADGCDAVAIVCTNMKGADVARRVTRDCGVPVLDSVVVALWAALEAARQPARADALLASEGISLRRK